MGKRGKRRLIQIDESLCDGCGDCVSACHEGALQLVDGKARLVKDSYCDGLGACIGDCPRGAITIVEREAEPFDERAAQAAAPEPATPPPPSPALHAAGGCPGSALRSFGRAPAPARDDAAAADQPPPSRLGHWPVQLMLVPPHAPFLQGADLLVCADCVPFTVPDFHARYLQDRAVVVGCPKLDNLEHYAEKLRLMFEQARPARVTVVRMQVPCCRGLADIAVAAAQELGIPVEEHIVGVQGGIARHTAAPRERQRQGA
jgi:NAD-dependent dihydropyrimidine dehydrogenase PreA subunit